MAGETPARCGRHELGNENVAGNRVAVLASGGLDSSILLVERLRAGECVTPIFVRSGFAWEGEELRHLRQFLECTRAPNLRDLVILEVPARDLLTGHWSLTGRGVPDEDSPDEAVLLPGRNVLLLSKAMIWCQLNGEPRLLMATMRGNPFADASERFVRAFQDAVNLGIGGAVRVEQPYAALSKPEVLSRADDAPLEWTLCCLQPAGGLHCGRCNKCEERRRAFAAAGLTDPAQYAAVSR